MIISINRDSVCMGDDAIDHRKEIELADNATGHDLLNKLLKMNYLPDLTDGIWYTWSLKTPCIIAWSCKKKKVIAEVKDLTLLQVGDGKTFFDFQHLSTSDIDMLINSIKKTPGIWYDKHTIMERKDGQ